MNLRQLLSRLNSILQRPGATFPVYDLTAASVRPHGLAYVVEPGGRREDRASWFSRTQPAVLAQQEAARNGRHAPLFDEHAVTYLVHWPQLLSRAMFSLRWGPDLALVAHGLLWRLQGLVAQYDAVLAWDLARFEERWTRAPVELRERPGFYGQVDGADEERFDRHLKTLLGNRDFRRHLQETMRATLHGATAVSAQRRLGACPVGRHPRGVTCDECSWRRWAKRNTSLLRPSVLGSHDFLMRVKLVLHAPEHFGHTTNAWLKELEFLLASLPADGVRREGEDLVLVDFAGLVRMAESQERKDSPLLRPYLAVASMDYWMRGYAARDAFERRFPQVIAPRTESLETLVKAAGWEWREGAQQTLDLPYGLYSAERIYRVLEHANKRAKASLEGPRRPKVQPKARTPKIATTYYTDEAGVTHEIRIVRRKPTTLHGQRNVYDQVRSYYTVPYALDSVDLLEKHRHGVSVKVGPEVFWTPRGVNRHATALDKYGHHVYPTAPHYAEWLIQFDTSFDAKKFNALRFDETLGKRIGEVQRGERQKLGRFTTQEDQVLREFILSRPHGVRKIEKYEWEMLYGRLLGRSRISILRRIDALGFDYALQHGWAAYVNSPWCLRNTAVRRKRWYKEGVKP